MIGINQFVCLSVTKLFVLNFKKYYFKNVCIGRKIVAISVIWRLLGQRKKLQRKLILDHNLKESKELIVYNGFNFLYNKIKS